MHHLQYRTTREPVVHDLSAVDDSEPERQEARRLQKEKKRAAKSNQENYPTQPLDALSARGPNAGNTSNAVISISSTDPTDISSSLIVPPADMPATPPEPSTFSRMLSNRFSFQADPPAFPPPSNPGKRAVTPAAVTKPLVKPIKNQASNFDVSNATMSKLDRCVSCGAKWTSRKTTDQKLLHIRRCARKHRLEDETVGVLIRQQINEAAEAVAPVLAGPSSLLSKRTLLEDVVGVSTETGKGTKTKASIKSTNVAHDFIRERAQALLGPSAPVETSSTAKPPYISHSVNSLPFDDGTDSGQTSDIPIPPSTQAFGSSHLQTHANVLVNKLTSSTFARKRAVETPRLNAETIPMMPSTQAFGSSNLGNRLTGSRLPGTALLDKARREESDTAYHDDDFTKGFSALRLQSPSSSIPSSPHKTSPARVEGLATTNLSEYANNELYHDDYDNMNYGVEDGILHWDGQDFPGTSTIIHSPSLVTAALIHSEQDFQEVNTTKTATASPSSKRKKAAKSQSPELATVRPKKIARKKKNADEIPEADLHRQLRESIVADTELYLRILRYEVACFSRSHFDNRLI
ncbi:hypothetical protein SISSUDRAFT_1030118 [Sistotremastrum suecicum HHB10207 ss-3]|uniref:Uncharacterized protein n=1 Tax=Sistotremastrum suecicum HHB10207 ss-3 TaxID=1314776 RepID=A0A166HNE7_9AGAM|nr:hypothetical protein SISSUDRAFT_1030118 [Sistotremastrum suecicum HHB10207 ss-3]